MIANLYLRSVPEMVKAGIRHGTLKVYGSVVRDVANGRIVKHLQPTGGLSKIIELVASGPLAPLELIGTGIQIVQNEQIKGGIARVEQAVAMLNQLQIGNFALSAAGIGTSVVGFAITNHKIDGVRKDVRALGDRLDRLLDVFAQDRAERLDDMLEALRGLARQIDDRWSMTSERAATGWQRDADEAARFAGFFEGRARRMLTAQPLAIAEATPLLDATVMASGLRIGALALSGEMATAINVAHDDAARLEQMTGGIGASDLLRARLEQIIPVPGDATASDALEQASRHARETVVGLRHREAATATRAAPLIALEAKGASARDWFSAARAETDAPLLLMEG